MWGEKDDKDKLRVFICKNGEVFILRNNYLVTEDGVYKCERKNGYTICNTGIEKVFENEKVKVVAKIYLGFREDDLQVFSIFDIKPERVLDEELLRMGDEYIKRDICNRSGGTFDENLNMCVHKLPCIEIHGIEERNPMENIKEKQYKENPRIKERDYVLTTIFGVIVGIMIASIYPTLSQDTLKFFNNILSSITSTFYSKTREFKCEDGTVFRFVKNECVRKNGYILCGPKIQVPYKDKKTKGAYVGYAGLREKDKRFFALMDIRFDQIYDKELQWIFKKYGKEKVLEYLCESESDLTFNKDLNLCMFKVSYKCEDI